MRCLITAFKFFLILFLCLKVLIFLIFIAIARLLLSARVSMKMCALSRSRKIEIQSYADECLLGDAFATICKGMTTVSVVEYLYIRASALFSPCFRVSRSWNRWIIDEPAIGYAGTTRIQILFVSRTVKSIAMAISTWSMTGCLDRRYPSRSPICLQDKEIRCPKN